VKCLTSTRASNDANRKRKTLTGQAFLGKGGNGNSFLLNIPVGTSHCAGSDLFFSKSSRIKGPPSSLAGRENTHNTGLITFGKKLGEGKEKRRGVGTSICFGKRREGRAITAKSGKSKRSKKSYGFALENRLTQ